MKAMVVSDIHLKFSAPFAKITPDGIDSRVKELLDSLAWAAEEGIKNKCQLFIIGGDVFDSAQRLPTVEGIKVRETLRAITEKYTKTIVLVGNHDMLSETENIMQLFDDIVDVVAKPTSITVQGARLSFLPYQRDKENLLKEMKALADCKTVDPHYLFGHFWLASDIMNDPEAPALQELPYTKFEKLFTGHLHAPTKSTLVDKSPVIYLGTIANKSFSETGPKGGWVVDFTKKTYTFLKNPHSPEFFSTTDAQIRELSNENMLRATAYYKVECDPVNILEITKILSGTVNGFEIVNKEVAVAPTTQVDASIVFAEKKNANTLKQFILSRADAYKPDSVSSEDFLQFGENLLKDLS